MKWEGRAESKNVEDRRSFGKKATVAAGGGGILILLLLGYLLGVDPQKLAEIGELKAAGCVGVSDDGKTLMDNQLMRLAMDYEPQGLAEKAGDAVGIMSSRVQNSVENFKKFIENRGAETGGWRGEVRGGRKTR